MDLHAPPIEVSAIPDGYRVTFRAPIQMDTTELEDELERVISAKPKRVEVDLGYSDHLSTVGLGLLISLSHRIHAVGGDLKIVKVRKNTYGVLQITKLDRVLK